MAHVGVSQGPSVSHFCGRSRPGAILVTPCHSTPSGSSPQQPEGDLEISDGTGSLEAVQTALKEADDGSESSIGSSSKKGSSGLKGIVVRLGAVCSITALIWAIFDSGNAALRIAAGVVGTALSHLPSGAKRSGGGGGGGGGVCNVVHFPLTLIAGGS